MEATNGIGLRWRLRNWSFFFIFRAEALADWRTSCHTAPGDLFGLSPLFFSQRGGRRGGFPPPFVFTVQWTLDELSRQLFSISPPFVFWAVAYDSSGLDWETAAAATVGTCCHANAPSDPRTDSSVWNNALCRKKKKIDIDLSGFVEKEKCSPCLRLVNADVTDVAAAAERVGTQELDGILIPVECVLTSRRIWVPLSLYVLLFAFRWPMQHILAYRERTSQFLFCFVTGICNDQNVYAQRVAPTPGLSDSDGARSLFFFFLFLKYVYTYGIYIKRRERERERPWVFLKRLVGRTCAPVFIFGSCWSYCWFSFSLLHQQQQPETTWLGKLKSVQTHWQEPRKPCFYFVGDWQQRIPGEISGGLYTTFPGHFEMNSVIREEKSI